MAGRIKIYFLSYVLRRSQISNKFLDNHIKMTYLTDAALKIAFKFLGTPRAKKPSFPRHNQELIGDFTTIPDVHCTLCAEAGTVGQLWDTCNLQMEFSQGIGRIFQEV